MKKQMIIGMVQIDFIEILIQSISKTIILRNKIYEYTFLKAKQSDDIHECETITPTTNQNIPSESPFKWQQNRSP